MVLICGLPNSGKTTFSEQYENVIHLDDYGRRINEVVFEATGDIVVEGVFVLRQMRKKAAGVISRSGTEGVHLA